MNNYQRISHLIIRHLPWQQAPLLFFSFPAGLGMRETYTGFRVAGFYTNPLPPVAA
jgi:hypothetical protein